MNPVLTLALIASCVAACAAPTVAIPRNEIACSSLAPTRHHWWHDAVGYEIFVRSFYDGDGDGTGDLRGLTQRLDHVQELGADLIWLMPISPSPSYHGYDVTDYDGVEPDYGTEEDLKRFIGAAKQRGIRVITDLVLNHTSVEHPWFQRALSTPDSPMRDRYIFRRTDPGWTQPWSDHRTWHKTPSGDVYYGLFWSGMPDLNYRNAWVRTAMINVATRWLDRGIDGFRLDAIRYLVETNGKKGRADTAETLTFLARFAEQTRKHSPDRYLIGEIWANTRTIAPYLKHLDAAFDFDLSSGFLAGVQGEDAALIRNVMCQSLGALPVGKSATFLTNHDMRRVASRVTRPERRELLAFLLLSGPGTPWIYYGEEIGMLNGPSRDDRDKRRAMDWTQVTAQSANPKSLFNRYRSFIEVRKRLSSLRRGDTYVLKAGGDNLLVMVRRGLQTLVAAVNLTAAHQSFTLPLQTGDDDIEHLSSLGVKHEGRTLQLPPFGYTLIELR